MSRPEEKVQSKKRKTNSETCNDLMNGLDEIKEKISNDEYVKLCDNIKDLHSQKCNYKLVTIIIPNTTMDFRGPDMEEDEFRDSYVIKNDLVKRTVVVDTNKMDHVSHLVLKQGSCINTHLLGHISVSDYPIHHHVTDNVTIVQTEAYVVEVKNLE